MRHISRKKKAGGCGCRKTKVSSRINVSEVSSEKPIEKQSN